MGEALLFYLFSTILIFSAFVVVLGRNAVHSVLFLIVSFLNAAGLFLLREAELLSMLLVIVYVGAVAVLFLFVVMMVDVNARDVKKRTTGYGLLGGLLGGLLLTELIIAGAMWSASSESALSVKKSAVAFSGKTNAHSLGEILYTDYVLIFQVSGLVLFVAMIGAIVLTLRHRSQVQRQQIKRQVDRSIEDTLEMKKVPFRQGIS